MPHRDLTTGVRLYFEDDSGGDANAAPVVFVNGLTMSTESWAPLVVALGGRRRTLRYDCRGQGRSDAPAGPYPPELHADDLVALLEALELGRFHLVGLSNGGLVAQLVAGRLGAGRVRSLAAVDSFGRVDALMRLLLASWRRALDCGGSALRFDVATPWVWGAAFAEAHLDEILAFRERAAASDPAAVRNLIDGLEAHADACDADGDAGALAALGRYRGPVLALVGEDDVLTPPRYSRDLVAAAHPTSDARLEILPGLGHAAPIEDPPAVAAVLERFWRDAEIPRSEETTP